MKIYIILITAFSLLLSSQTKVNIDPLKLSGNQVWQLAKAGDYIYIANFESGNKDKMYLDRYNTLNETIEKDILSGHNPNMTFGNSNLFVDSRNNLWIGDINRFYKLEPSGKFTSFYEDYVAPDSTYFEIKSFTETDNGDIFIAKSNAKIVLKGETNGTGWRHELSDLDLLKYKDEQLELIKNFEDVVFMDNKLAYINNKVYIPSTFDTTLTIYDLEKNSTEELVLENLEFTRFGWEEVKDINIEDIIEFKGDIYFVADVRGKSGSYTMSFIKLNSDGSFQTFTMERNKEYDTMNTFSSYTVSDEGILCAKWTASYENREFLIFDGEDFRPYEFSINDHSLITNTNFTKYINDNDFKIEELMFDMKQGLILDDNGTLYAGTTSGLFKFDNFMETTNVDENQSLIKNHIKYTELFNLITISSEINIDNINVYNLNGEILQSNNNIKSKDVNINLQDYPKGIYFIQVKDKTGNSIIKINN